MEVLRTERLRLRQVSLHHDGAFLIELLNEPAFILNVRDCGIFTEDDAREYMKNGPLKSYEGNGFGGYVVEIIEKREDGSEREEEERYIPVGLCGIYKRDFLPHPDLGYAFLERNWKRGYAREAARGVIQYARDTLHISTLLAIIDPKNAPSIKLAESLGFILKEQMDDPASHKLVNLYIISI